MKILILGDAPSSHIIKWANALSDKGHQIYVFSLLKSNGSQYREDVKIIYKEISTKLKYLSSGNFIKLIYLLALPVIKKIIKEIKPDILHAHYASSYGLLGSLTKFHPYVLSVWGTDVFNFPLKSFFHKNIFNFNLRMADTILSTSEVMAKEIKKYTGKQILVTPFGIDINIFKPGNKVNLIKGEFDFVIGTIKGLEEMYGIEYLIDAYCIVKERLKPLKIKLLIVGGGSLENKIRSLIIEKKLLDEIILTGKVNYSDIQNYHNLLDIYIALSIYDDESFGVAILEASACGKPVLVSNVGGLPEVVENNKTGFIVPPRNAESAAEKIIELINNEELRTKFGQAGRERVITHYNWEICVQKMLDIYESVK